MKRVISLFLAFIMLFSMLLPSAMADKVIENETDFIASLSKGKQSSLSLICSPEYFSELTADNYRQLLLTLMKAGIDIYEVSYGKETSSNSIELRNVVRAGIPYAQCDSIEQVEASLASFVSSNTDRYYILCSNQLMEQLNRDTLSSIAASQGVDSLNLSTLQELDAFFIRGMQYFTVPYAYISSREEFFSAIEDFKGNNLSDFYIVFSHDLLNLFSNNNIALKQLIEESKISDCIYVKSNYYLSFHGVEYSDAPCFICSSPDDVSTAIVNAGLSGQSDFDLFFPDTSVCKKLKDNSFKLFDEITTKAGLLYYERLTYSMDDEKISVKGAEIVSDAIKVNTFSDALDHLKAATESGTKLVNLMCSEQLFNSLLGEMLVPFTYVYKTIPPIFDLLLQAGIVDFDLSYVPPGAITIEVKELYPGHAILLADRSGDSSLLSSKEVETWAKAKEIAAAASAYTDPLERAKFIHDWLCENVDYLIDDNTDEDDNAIGAILNGKANCDGYSDAFYLIGNLANLEVLNQQGHAKSSRFTLDFSFSPTPLNHIWNIIKIDGTWRMVDVTQDDNGEGVNYFWFNVGQDVARRMHDWNGTMSMPLAKNTDRVIKNYYEFYVDSKEEAIAAVTTAVENQYEQFYIFYNDLSASSSYEEALDLLRNTTDSSFSYSWTEELGLLCISNLVW